MTTPDQRAQACPACDVDPHAAPGRYCASLACRCGHPACPAAASWVPREGQAHVIHLPERKAPSASAWAAREEGSSWIDKL